MQFERRTRSVEGVEAGENRSKHRLVLSLCRIVDHESTMRDTRATLTFDQKSGARDARFSTCAQAPSPRVVASRSAPLARR
jgi:hypothetical protein